MILVRLHGTRYRLSGFKVNYFLMSSPIRHTSNVGLSKTTPFHLLAECLSHDTFWLSEPKRSGASNVFAQNASLDSMDPVETADRLPSLAS